VGKPHLYKGQLIHLLFQMAGGQPRVAARQGVLRIAAFKEFLIGSELHSGS